jgi:pSer/pThr/pTyr-binding forkhead associated (FHA) protein
MAKLVIQNQGMAGRACELLTDRTTIGRVDDNTFHIADASVSSHHCEVHLRGNEIFIRDLNSTNGTFINNDKINEGSLKPGQTLRLGQVELKLEIDGLSTPGISSSPPPPPRKQVDATVIIPRGVSLSDLEKGGRPAGFDSTSTVFTKKTNKGNKMFWIAAIVGGVIIIGLLVYVFAVANHK